MRFLSFSSFSVCRRFCYDIARSCASCGVNNLDFCIIIIISSSSSINSNAKLVCLFYYTIVVAATACFEGCNLCVADGDVHCKKH